MESREDLMAEMAFIERQLQASDAATETLISELIGRARALQVPTDERRDDSHVFVEGTESIEGATWTQCGGLLFALGRKEIVQARDVASRVALRLLELAPTHR